MKPKRPDLIKILRTRLLGYRPDFGKANNQRILERTGRLCRPLIESVEFDRQCVGRAFAQFLGQAAHRSVFHLGITEAIAAIFLPGYLAMQWIRSLPASPRDRQICDGLRLVHRQRFEVNREIYQVPPGLSELKICTKFYTQGYLGWREIKLIFFAFGQSLRVGCRWNFQFTLKIAKDLASLKESIDQYDARFLLVYREYDCSLSLITYWCRNQGIQVFNVMHGDKYFSSLDSYFLVDRCYCWHEYYVTLFKRQLVDCPEYLVFDNPLLAKTDKAEYEEPEGVGVVMPAAYTLAPSAARARVAMDLFISEINSLSESLPVSLRPHPLHRDHYEAVKHRFSPRIKISDAREETSIDFIVRHKAIVGTHSTLLLESTLMGRDTFAINTPRLSEISGDHFIFEYPNMEIIGLENMARTFCEKADYAKPRQNLSR